MLQVKTCPNRLNQKPELSLMQVKIKLNNFILLKDWSFIKVKIMTLNILLCFFFSEGGEEEEEGHFPDGDMQLEGQEERKAGEAEEVMDQGNDEEFDEIAEFLGINPDQLQIRQDLVDRIAV